MDVHKCLVMQLENATCSIIDLAVSVYFLPLISVGYGFSKLELSLFSIIQTYFLLLTVQNNLEPG
jgi:hypothetical protein